MKTIKITDLAIQYLLMAGSIPYVVFHWGGSASFLHPYFAVGAWQLTSFILHGLASKNLFFRKERKQYGITNIWIFGLGAAFYAAASLEFPLVFFYLIAMLFVGPIMAFWYSSICFREIKLMTNKELVHLK